jgi:hypothetical protein
VKQSIEAARLGRPLSSIPDVIGACTEFIVGGDDDDQKMVSLVRHEFIDYIPLKKHMLPLTKFDNGPLPLRSVHIHHYRINDVRRKSLVGKGLQARMLTGVTASMHILPGEVAGPALTWFPTIREQHLPPRPEDEEHDCIVPEFKCSDDEEDCAEPPGSNAMLGSGIRTMGGWRVSYRLDEPENHTYNDNYKKRLRWKRSHSMWARDAEGPRHADA